MGHRVRFLSLWTTLEDKISVFTRLSDLKLVDLEVESCSKKYNKIKGEQSCWKVTSIKLQFKLKLKFWIKVLVKCFPHTFFWDTKEGWKFYVKSYFRFFTLENIYKVVRSTQISLNMQSKESIYFSLHVVFTSGRYIRFWTVMISPFMTAS